MEQSDIHEYPTEGLNVIWQPKKCIHAGICVKMLPQVYNPKDRPWVKPENATKEQLIEQIKSCPSGALSFKLK